MGFTQVIEVRADDPGALRDHVAAYDARERDRAPGYRRARVLEDGERSGTYVIEVDFTSADLAQQNSARPETEEWARRLRDLVEGEPSYRNLNQLCSTEGA